MYHRRQRLAQTARRAAIALTLCSAIVLGASGLLLQLVLWNQPTTGESPRFYTEIPGIDLKAVAPARLPALLKRLNAQHCPCECMRTVASCRNNHRSCRESVEAAQKVIVAEQKAR